MGERANFLKLHHVIILSTAFVAFRTQIVSSLSTNIHTHIHPYNQRTNFNLVQFVKISMKPNKMGQYSFRNRAQPNNNKLATVISYTGPSEFVCYGRKINLQWPFCRQLPQGSGNKPQNCNTLVLPLLLAI